MKQTDFYPYPLNALENSILAWESSEIAFNSHMIVDLKNPLDASRLQSALEKIFNEVPLFRTFIIREGKNWNRYACKKPWFNSADYLDLPEKYSSEAEENFLEKSFDLEKDPPLRIFYTPLNESEWRLIISVHHSSCDGIGQTYLLHEFFLAYEGQPLSAWTQKAAPLNFSSYLTANPLKALRGLISGIQSITEKKKAAATLLTDRTSANRSVRIRYLPVGKVDFKQVCSAVLKTLDQMTPDQKHLPLTLAIPVNIRSYFRINKGFHNFAGVCRIEFSRNELDAESIQLKLQSLQSFKIAAQGFYSAIIAKLLMKPEQLQKKFRSFDNNPNAVFSSSLISMSRLPSQVKLPEHLGVLRVFGRGSLFKSPGLGITVTGPRDHLVLVIQYLKSSISEERIEELKDSLLFHLQGSTPEETSRKSSTNRL